MEGADPGAPCWSRKQQQKGTQWPHLRVEVRELSLREGRANAKGDNGDHDDQSGGTTRAFFLRKPLLGKAQDNRLLCRHVARQEFAEGRACESCQSRLLRNRRPDPRNSSGL